MRVGNIKFNNKSSKEFNIKVSSVKISYPKPILKIEKVPYSNNYIDLSNVDGTTEYEQREIEVTFNFDDYFRTSINSIYSSIVTWLYSSKKSDLEIDYVRGRFKARVVDITDMEHLDYTNKITVKFIADPFVIGHKVNADIWDDFNFVTDVIQENIFEVSGKTKIKLINSGMDVVPTINSNSNMSILINNSTYILTPGKNKIPVLYIKNGVNEIEVTGTGTITFDFNILYI